MTSHTPRRIVCLQPSASVILAATGELDRVVACTKYCFDVVPELAARSCQIVADSWTASADEISNLHPDLVIASVPYQQQAVAEILRAGVRFLGLAPRTLADIYSDIAVIAGAVGVAGCGEQVIAGMQEKIATVQSQTAGLPRPRVFCEEWGKPLIASQPWVAKLVEAAGGECVGDPGRQITIDAVIRLDPEILIFAWCGAGDRVPLEKMVTDRRWQGMRAVQTGRVYCIRDEYLNTPAPTLVCGLDALAFAIHPERFPQVGGIRQITAVPSSTTGNARL